MEKNLQASQRGQRPSFPIWWHIYEPFFSFLAFPSFFLCSFSVFFIIFSLVFRYSSYFLLLSGEGERPLLFDKCVKRTSPRPAVQPASRIHQKCVENLKSITVQLLWNGSGTAETALRLLWIRCQKRRESDLLWSNQRGIDSVVCCCLSMRQHSRPTGQRGPMNTANEEWAGPTVTCALGAKSALPHFTRPYLIASDFSGGHHVVANRTASVLSFFIYLFISCFRLLSHSLRLFLASLGIPIGFFRWIEFWEGQQAVSRKRVWAVH